MSSVSGQAVERVDAQEKVTGRGVYTGDIKLPGMLQGKVLRSSLPHARIKRIEWRGAASLPGVMAVLTRETVPLKFPYYGGFRDQGVVAVDKVRYEGDVVAAVAAVDEGVADEALKRLEVEYEELAVVETVDEALREGAPLVHEEMRGHRAPKYGRGGSHVVHEGSNICLHFRYERGEWEKGMGEADHVFEDTFEFPSLQHYALEPHASVANFDADKLTVWSCSQSPFMVRHELAELFQLSLSQVRIIVPYLGGGFGAKDGIRTEALAAALSRLAGRPVRVAFRGDETFRTICQPKAKVTIRTGVKKDGTLVARRCELIFNTGAYSNNSPIVTQKACYRAHGPYRIPHVLTDAYCVYTNTVPGAAFRGFGGPQAGFAYDSHMDMIADRLGMDALELRLKNILGRGEEYAAGDTPIDCDLEGGLKRVAQAIGWAEKEKGSKDKKLSATVKRGKGIACVIKDSGGTSKPAHAIVKILGDGSVLLSFGSAEMGQGIRTALAQVVANELGIPFEEVRVGELDTQYTPYDRSTNASSGISVMGQAVMRAVDDARGQLVSVVASRFGIRENGVRLEGGKVVAGDRKMSLREAMSACLGESEEEIVGKGFFMMTPSDQTPLGCLSVFWEVGIGGAEVEVDEMTGEVKLVRYVSLTDAGKMINPLQCRGQDEGAAVFGIGLSLSEELLYEGGKLLNPNLVDYRLPRFRDLPQTFSTTIVEEGGGPGPYGAKGLGEGGILAVAPAVCNAVYDAIGIRVKEVPLKSKRVWNMVGTEQENVLARSRNPKT